MKTFKMFAVLGLTAFGLAVISCGQSNVKTRASVTDTVIGSGSDVSGVASLGRYEAIGGRVKLDFWSLPDFPPLTVSLKFLNSKNNELSEIFLIRPQELADAFNAKSDLVQEISTEGNQKIKLETKVTLESGKIKQRTVDLTMETKIEDAVASKVRAIFLVNGLGKIESVKLKAQRRSAIGFVTFPWFDKVFDDSVNLTLAAPGIEIRELGTDCRAADNAKLLDMLIAKKSSSAELSALCK